MNTLMQCKEKKTIITDTDDRLDFLHNIQNVIDSLTINHKMSGNIYFRGPGFV